MAYSAEAFNAANQPGRGSNVGDFVPGKHGGWVPANHPDAATDSPLPGLGGDTPTRVEGDPGGLPAAGDGGNVVGTNMGEAGPTMQMAFDGLKAAAGGGGGMGGGVEQVSAPSSGNPMLGQRIYPASSRVLGQAYPRIY